jgi:hypothetical protein
MQHIQATDSELRAAEIIERHRNTRPAAEVLRSLQLSLFSDDKPNYRFRGEGEEGSWFIKFCTNVDNRIPDICERELLISLLGQLLDVRVVSAWSIPATDLPALQLPEDPSLIRDKAVVMPWLNGSTVEGAKDQAMQLVLTAPDCIAELFAFMHWVGDEDRGLVDVFLEDGRLVLIDNGLCGPGRDSLLRGAHPSPGTYHTQPDSLIEMCYPGKPSLVAFVLRDVRISITEVRSPKVIDRIQALSDAAIHAIVQAAGLGSWIGDILILRRELIQASYLEWLAKAIRVCVP